METDKISLYLRAADPTTVRQMAEALLVAQRLDELRPEAGSAWPEDRARLFAAWDEMHAALAQIDDIDKGVVAGE